MPSDIVMNLLVDPWITLRRRSGAIERVAPWQVTDRHDDDPFTGFASVRPDFDGAIAQVLIGLLQTALPPKEAKGWRQSFDSPPAPVSLREAFQPLAFAFELFADGPRFLQDLTLEAAAPREDKIERLLIESPGENTLKQGRDHFVKGGQIEALCPACAATALACLQINAPSGGQGHRTGLRGGGPLTTLVVDPKSLWKTLWLNVLPASSLEHEPRAKDRLEDRFPWLAPTRTSGKDGGGDTTLEDVHPLQMFWGMPRRLRLRPGLSTEPEGMVCSLCAGSERPLVRTFFNLNLGVNYTGSWNHPLTPYRTVGEIFSPLHGSPAGLSYQNWLGLVQNDPESQVRRAMVVEALLGDNSSRAGGDYLLWAFGYNMDNMKARSWQEARMPLPSVSAEHRRAFELDAQRLVRASAEAERALSLAAKQALTRRPPDLVPTDIGVRFRQETEAPFYRTLQRIYPILEANEDTVELRQHWKRELDAAANRAFESATALSSFQATDPRRAARAWRGLQLFFRSEKLQEILELPTSLTEAGTTTAGLAGGAKLRRSFPQHASAMVGMVLREWHAGLGQGELSRTRLRGVVGPNDVLLQPCFHQLLATLRPVLEVDDPTMRRNLAAFAGLAARVWEPLDDFPLARQMSTPIAHKNSWRPAVSEKRFRRLLTAPDLEARYTQLVQVIQLLDHRIDLLSLADAVCYWDTDPELRRQWTYDYYYTDFS